ncbi:MAG: Gfo/Idh/MocA family oxidoreductase [Acidobacteria bacterium]|nr:Gfo/Idh/MocA family oxidoreductase [Acidobacteriota bacterium]
MVDEATETERPPSTDREIRVAVIGVGQMGRHHARVYRAQPGVRLMAVCDKKLERARAVADEFGTSTAADFRDLLPELDAVTIAVPTEAHAEVAGRVLEAGVDVLVEKPISRTLEEADALIAQASSLGRILQVGHLERFNPAILAIRSLVSSPRFFEAHRLGSFTERSLDIDVIMDLMVHDLDVILSLVPSVPRSITAVGIPILTPRLDIANARIEFEDGCVANLTASRISKDRTRKLRFFQPFQYISIDYTRQEVEVFSLEPGTGKGSRPGIGYRMLDVEKAEPLQLEIEAFLSSVRDRTCPRIDGNEGRRALALAIDVRRAIEEHQLRAGNPFSLPT